MDIEQLQDAFQSLTSAEQRMFLNHHMRELRETLGVSPQMLMEDEETDMIVTELIGSYGMSVSDLLDVFCDIDGVRSSIEDYAYDDDDY